VFHVVRSVPTPYDEYTVIWYADLSFDFQMCIFDNEKQQISQMKSDYFGTTIFGPPNAVLANNWSIIP